jgi:hypothetical protein
MGKSEIRSHCAPICIPQGKGFGIAFELPNNIGLAVLYRAFRSRLVDHQSYDLNSSRYKAARALLTVTCDSTTARPYSGRNRGGRPDDITVHFCRLHNIGIFFLKRASKELISTEAIVCSKQQSFIL